MSHVIAAYTIAALTLIFYEVRLWGQVRRLRREKGQGQGADGSAGS